MNKNNKKQTPKKRRPKNLKEFEVTKRIGLLDFLLETFKDQSRNSVKSLLSSHKVSIDGAPISQFDFQLNKGDKVIISPTGIKKKLRSNLPIIYEDDELIVINKPTKLLSVASDTEYGSTAYRIVTDYVQQKNKHNRIYVCHRIDEDTSGVLMFAKNPELQKAFQDNWNDLVIKRGYFAIVDGCMENDIGTIKSYLKMNAMNLMYSSHKKGGGKLSTTHYKVIRKNKDYSLLDVTIDSGRKNQIRVHMGDIGHYVIGDDKYGNPTDPLKRLGLHAYVLEITHPFTKKKLKFNAPIPKEFSKIFPKDK